MGEDKPFKTAVALGLSQPNYPGAIEVPPGQHVKPTEYAGRCAVFWFAWHICSSLLVLSTLLTMYSAAWEWSTRRYLEGFSDAVVPADSKPVEKIQAILSWMSGSAANDTSAFVERQDRNPEDTLNFTSLLKICGTATNAFINLADSAGLTSRRLLLLGPHQVVNHVVAEVLIDGRWIVVDPVFRVIPRGPGGALLTREGLADPAVFSAATGHIPNYDPSYTYQRTEHVHLERLPYIGRFLRKFLNVVLPGWQASPELSLILERESLAALVLAVSLLIFLALLRVGLRWYGEARLGIQGVRMRTRLLRACHAFVSDSRVAN